MPLLQEQEKKNGQESDVSIDRDGNITEKGVDKYGIQEMEEGKIVW